MELQQQRSRFGSFAATTQSKHPIEARDMTQHQHRDLKASMWENLFVDEEFLDVLLVRKQNGRTETLKNEEDPQEPTSNTLVPALLGNDELTSVSKTERFSEDWSRHWLKRPRHGGSLQIGCPDTQLLLIRAAQYPRKHWIPTTL